MNDRKNQKKRIAAVLVSVFLAASLGGCGMSAESALSNGAEKYAEGKKETDYPIVSADQLLDDLIHNYADAHDTPTGNQLDDDEAEDKANDLKDGEDDGRTDSAADSDGSAGNDSSADSVGSGGESQPDSTDSGDSGETESTVPDVFSYDDMKSLVREMYLNNEKNAVYDLNGSYIPSADDILLADQELESEIPLDSIGMSAFSYGTYSDMDGMHGIIEIDYDFDTDTLREMKEEQHVLIRQAEAQIDIGGGSDYEIADAVNRYLCNNVEYTSGEYTVYPAECHTPYLALKEGNCVCDGYARTACQMLQDFGLEAMVQLGQCPGGGHAWNIVKVDGEWYQLDVCWDDAAGAYNADWGNDYFLVTDDYMKQSRTWDYSQWPASAAEPYKAA